MKLSINQLGKVYQDGNIALDGFNLKMNEGVFGLLGPNGAGKSTLLEILSLNLMPTTGKILWNGADIQKNPKEFRRVLGYLPQTYGFYDELTTTQLLSYMGRLAGLSGRRLRSRIDESLERVNLLEGRKQKIKSFSGGMKQRLAIAQALIGSPEILVIDEPTTGLDPAERVSFRNMLFDLGASSVVIISTHIVKDVEFSCQQMTLLYGGVQRFMGEPGEFIGRVDDRVFEVEMPFGDFEAFTAERHVIAIHEHGGRVDVRFISPERQTDVPGAQFVKANLEDAYIDFIRKRQAEESLAEAG